MRVKSFYRVLRIVAAIELCFFVWTFCSVWESVAFAATSQKPNNSRGFQSEQKQRPEERFAAALEDIREKIGKAGAKADKGEDDTAERESIRTKRASIDQISEELRAEFSSTERKLKDAKLPKEILDRHAKFVKNYENNLKELRANLDDIDLAKTTSDRKAKIEKARLHLERVKAPSRHQKLDPNNLPFKAGKAGKTREPRLKKEQFEKDFPSRKSPRSQRIAELEKFYNFEFRKETRPEIIGNSALNHKPIQLAFNGPISDMPLQLPRPLGERTEVRGGFDLPQIALADSAPFLIALATDAPTPDDLASTPEIQVDSQLIRAKAQELACSPVKLYEWTRNEIYFTPTYGAIQGAEMCLQTKECNALDTNALLVALLRSCNIPARLNVGTVEVSIDKVMNWAGGFSDPTTALNYLASGGIPVTGLRSGGKIYAARLETAWVRAFVDYIPSFGAVQKEGDTWIPLDASYKQYTYTDGIDLQAAVPFNAQNLVDQIKATATINEQESYVTNVNSTVIETALNDYNFSLETYVTDNFPNATPGDILGKKVIIRKDQPILPASLPYKVVVAGTESSEIPEPLKHKITIQLADANNPGSAAITYTTGLAQVAGKRVTVSYDPATTTDQTTINRYMEDYATSIPAYLVQFTPVLKVEGVVVATGPAVGMGNPQSLTVTIISPMGTEMVTHDLLAGDYTALGINPSKVSLDVLQKRIDKNDYSEPVGEMLHQVALSYWAEVDAFNSVIAKTMRVNNLRHPSELAAAAKVSVSYVWGVPTSATYESRALDVKLDNQSVATKSTDKNKEFYYMQQSGANSSFLEGAVYDQLFEGNIGDGISAITALKQANDQGIPIYKIDSSNISTVLSKLQVSSDVKAEISNAINAGLQVQIPQSNITKSGWTGVGYIVRNTTDGSGAYRISGGLNGDVSKTGNQTVTPTPQIALRGPAAMVVDSFAGNGNLKLQVKEMSGTYILMGVAVAGGTLAGGEILAAATLLAAFFAFLKTLAESQRLSPRWETFRHFTSKRWAKEIISKQYLQVGAEEGMYGAGIYLTKDFIQPDSAENAFGYMSYGPNCYLILTTLELYSIDKTEAYIDLSIDMNKRGVFPKRPPDEYLLMGMPLEVMPFGTDIRVIDYWYPGLMLP